jgi:hypothetical protein
LFAFVRFISVAHLVQASEWLSFDTSLESGCGFGYGALRRSQRDILKLRLADLLVRASQECPLGRVRSHATQALVIFARILIRIAKRIALELTESRFCIFATVNCHGTINTNFMTFFAEGLVVGTVVAHSKSNRHGEQGISLPR